MYRLLLLFITISFLYSQCEDGYYYLSDIDEDHIVSQTNCLLESDLNILDSLIALNNIDLNSTGLGKQTWNDEGRLIYFVLNYGFDQDQISEKISLLPSNFGDLNMLQELEMQYHFLTVLPISFTQLVNLETLSFKGNNLRLLNPDFGSLSSLVTLDVGYNEIVSLPESIYQLENLVFLWIISNEIEYIPDSICSLHIDWSGQIGDFKTFGSGGNHLCDNIPDCVINSETFNYTFEEAGYTTLVVSPQVCQCDDGSYPECDDDNYPDNNLCPNDVGYGGNAIDECGSCDNDITNDCSMDCLGNWGGISPTDECGICNALGATCAEYGTLSLSDNGDGTWNVEYDSPWDFGTFSFDIDDVDISNATGGAANDNGFIVTINESTIQGITFANTISKGQGILLIITINGDPSEITGITVADPVDNSGTLDFIYDDGTLETCDAGYDCLGICGGSAVVDECGVCDGGYRKIDWFIDSDGDGLGYSGDSLALCYEPTGYTSNSNDSDDDTFCPYENIVKSCDCYGNIEDCTGSCGGDATIDECGVCNGSGIPDWNCDCNGNILDECGVCGGGVEDILDCVCADGLQMDCNGHCADDLGYGAVSDCMGVCEGIAEIDTCGNCVGGDTGLEENYAMDECFVCNGDNSSCTGCMEQDADNYDIQLILNNTITRPCSDDDGNGKPDCCTYTLDAEENIMPLHFKLNQNYPNPFNPQTSISFEIPILTEVALNIYDVSGHLVYSWEKMNNNPGVYRITWDAAEYSSGIYFVTMTAGDYVDMQKLMLVK